MIKKKRKTSIPRTKKEGRTPKILLNEWGLNPQQEAFCVLYATDNEFFGNGVKSYCDAYDVNPMTKAQYNVVYVAASNLLRNNKIIARINSLLDSGGFNDVNVDKQHSFLINQFDDLKVKMRAVEHYDVVKGRVKDINKPGINITIGLAGEVQKLLQQQ